MFFVRFTLFIVRLAIENLSAQARRSEICWLLVFAATIVGAGAGATQGHKLKPRGAERPSFDCAQAKTAAARLICADGELARLDGELGAMFQRRKAQLAGSDKSLVEAQRSWIRDRNLRCGIADKSGATIEVLAQSKPCMANEIRERIVDLNSSSKPERSHTQVTEDRAAASSASSSADDPSANAQVSSVAMPGSLSMPIDFIGEWCSPFRDKSKSMYTLPSWTDEGKCTDILSINKHGFYFNSENIHCEPVSILLGKDTAPSGTTYEAIVSARCQVDGPTVGKLRIFEFSRYKGHLIIATHQSGNEKDGRSSSRFTDVPMTKPESVIADSLECSGILHQTGKDLIFGGEPGEEEGICLVNGTETGKVLQTCRVGKPCTVKGSGGLCKDSGECVHITSITSVRGEPEVASTAAQTAVGSQKKPDEVAREPDHTSSRDLQDAFDHDWQILTSDGKRFVELGALQYKISGWNRSLDVTLRDRSSIIASVIVESACDHPTELSLQWSLRVYLVDGTLAGQCKLVSALEGGLSVIERIQREEPWKLNYLRAMGVQLNPQRPLSAAEKNCKEVIDRNGAKHEVDQCMENLRREWLIQHPR